MSVPDNDISEIGGFDDDDDDRRDGVVHAGRRKNYGYGFSRNVAKAKKVVLFPFTKANKYLLRPSRKPNLKQKPSFTNDQSNGGGKSGERNRNLRIGSVKNSCFCFTQPQTLNSQTSDCNDSKFTFDMLKALIEENDFYSKECNPHLDFVSPSS